MNHEILQKALDITKNRFPTLSLMIKKGIFWNYFEENHRKLIIQEDKYYPCYYINSKLNSGYLMRVGYYKYRIFAEIYHSLADASSLISFFKSLLYHYFILLGKKIDDKNCDIFKDNIYSAADYDDSFFIHTRNKKCLFD